MMEESPKNTKTVPASDEQAPAFQPPLPKNLEEAYTQIGRTLLVAEAATTAIGIPWLPPTPRTQALRREFYEPLKDFVRQSLVGVPTPELESYAEDLETLPADEPSSARLHIGGLSHLERRMLSLILFFSAFALFFILSLWVNAGIGLALGLSLLVAAVISVVSGYICSEDSRRSTFHWVIFEEVHRRKGLDQPGGTPIPIAPILQTRAAGEL